MEEYKHNLVHKNLIGSTSNTHYLLIKNNYNSFINGVWYYGTIKDGAHRQYIGVRTDHEYGVFLIIGYGGFIQLYSLSNNVWTLYNINKQAA